MQIDFGAFTNTAEAQKEAGMLIWTALLADGTGALSKREAEWKPLTSPSLTGESGSAYSTAAKLRSWAASTTARLNKPLR
jgi:hypothetical protein